MKCKHCNGTGKIKMPTFDDAMPILEEDCGKCHGTGEIEVTNEEYIRSCSTEELAEVLLEIYKDGINDYKTDWWEDSKEDWMDWLKEEHHE